MGLGTDAPLRRLAAGPESVHSNESVSSDYERFFQPIITEVNVGSPFSQAHLFFLSVLNRLPEIYQKSITAGTTTICLPHPSVQSLHFQMSRGERGETGSVYHFT